MEIQPDQIGELDDTKDIDYKQAGAELGQAQPQLGLRFRQAKIAVYQNKLKSG